MDGSVVVGGVLVGGAIVATLVWFVTLKRSSPGHDHAVDGTRGAGRSLADSSRSDSGH